MLARLGHGLLGLALAGVSRLHADTACRLGAWFGLMAFHLGIRRGVVRENLRTTLGCRGRQRQRIARQSYATMGANFLEIWTVGTGHGPEVAFDCADPAWFAHCIQRHPGAIYLTLHLGNWDFAGYGYCVASGRPLLVLAKAQHDPVVDGWVNRQRQRAGLEVIVTRNRDRNGALTVIRGLRNGASVGVLADQKPQDEEGIPAYLLGRPTLCHAGPAILAHHGRAALLPSFSLRRRAGHTRLFIGRPIIADGIPQDVLIQALMDRISAMIAARPGQYFWQHRRFAKLVAGLPHRATEPWRERGIRIIADPIR